MFTIGADPEVFLIDKHLKYRSAIGLIGGTKEQPRALARKGFAVQEDNVTMEFNIPPADNADDFVNNIQYVLDTMTKRLKGMSFSHESALYFPEEQLQHPKAQEFGCEPDFNAWTKEMNPRPCATNKTLRSAGGHVHVGTKEDPIEVIRAMDLFLGVPSVKLDTRGGLRRQLYGNPGAFRPKSFGCEYRTLSNFWIFTPELIRWVYNQTEKALDFVESGSTIPEEDGAIIRDCILTGNENAYEHLLQTYRFS